MNKTSNSLKLLKWTLSFMILALIFINSFSCTNSEQGQKKSELTINEIIQIFNSKGRFARFENTKLIFGETISNDLRNTFLFEEINKNNEFNKIYRKSGFKAVTGKDTTYCFLYGLSKYGLILEELRIKLCDENSILNDTLLISKKQLSSNRYDYQFQDNNLTVIAYNAKDETHKTYYEINKGEVINKTFIPNTIFKKQNLLPDINRKVIIYDNFEDKTVLINGKSVKLTGKIYKFYGGGKSCPNYMMIKLDNTNVVKSGLVQTKAEINNVTELHELMNDDFRINKECFFDANYPKDEPKLLKKQVYLEYI